MKDESKIQDLIVRYLNGDYSESEIKELLAWINSSTNNQKEFLQINDLLDMANHKESKTAGQLILFYQKQLEKSKKERIRLIYSITAIAAVFLIGLVISVFISFENQYFKSTSKRLFCSSWFAFKAYFI